MILSDDLAETLRHARHVAALTGAGVSAESGLPTFRDALTGLWAQHRPEDLATPEAFERNPALVWSWYRMRREAAVRAQPNPAHLALVRLESLVPRFTLITQNVDGLHRRAGSRSVVELHGDITRVRCSRDGAMAERWEEPPEGGEPPRCEGCGAFLRPDVVWFGESLPEQALRRAWAAVHDCDVFLSAGTSNLVEPAASFPWLAASQGATVVVVNTTMDGQRSGAGIHHLAGPAGEVLPQLLEVAWGVPGGVGRG
ncbi:MAG TPA: NAD-dependent deacylase [Gemmatimonadales bacterium]|nr:NAD-dependent deacylase [Gemmatimonadales bacterium]